ncbi:MAG: phosphoesterase [Chlamydiae bacterium CG10_big_fil_rev_8_21_14_0_10_42_34]|nr:MAG: phosphoesterase [Chlamydiae bacterium CG10_big_fil_rev_8_21_14_0_10_42_34]
MRIWAIGDLHLSFGVENKSMEIFGPNWEDHAKKIASNWKSMIHADDLVLVPGDLSWALKVQEAVPDLQWVHELPGTKVMIKGNHDYWWGSLSKIAPVLPPSIHLIQNNVFNWKDVTIGGARLWDTPEYSFKEFIEFRENPKAKAKDPEELVQEEFAQKIFDRELERLKMSLKGLNPEASLRLAMTHYPPIGADLQPSRAAQILEQNNVEVCVFGHLHNLKPNLPMFGATRGVRYVLASCDYIHFQPIAVL